MEHGHRFIMKSAIPFLLQPSNCLCCTLCFDVRVYYFIEFVVIQFYVVCLVFCLLTSWVHVGNKCFHFNMFFMSVMYK